MRPFSRYHRTCAVMLPSLGATVLAAVLAGAPRSVGNSMAMRRALALSILTVACLAAGSSPAWAVYASGSLDYAAGTTSTAGMLDVGMVYNTVDGDPGTRRHYRAWFSDDTAGAARVARVTLERALLLHGSRALGRQIVAYVDTSTANVVDVTPGGGVTAVPYSNETAYTTADGGWTPGRSYRLRVRQIARPSGGRRFRVSVTNVVTGGERVIVDFTRVSLAALSLRIRGDAHADNGSTCESLFDARVSIDRPRGVRGSDGATIVADPSPRFSGTKPSDPGGPCIASQRRISTDRIVIDLGR